MSRRAPGRGLLLVLVGMGAGCGSPERSAPAAPVERCDDRVRVGERAQGLDSELPATGGARARRTVRHDVTIHDREGREERLLHDADEDGRVEYEYSLIYDAIGRVSVRNEGSLTERFFYDGEGRKIEERRDGGSWSARRLFSYDSQGRLAREVAEAESSSEVVEHTWDARGRPSTTTTTSEPSHAVRMKVSHSYDPSLSTHTERLEFLGADPYTIVTVAHVDADERPLLEERMDQRWVVYEIERHEYDEKGRVLLAETFDRVGGIDRVRVHESQAYDDATGSSWGFGFGEGRGLDCRSVTAPADR